MKEDTEPDGSTEYTKFSSKIQLGDGVDQRGDIQVEIARDRPSLGRRNEHTVELPSGDEVTVTVDDEAFAEFYFELQRSTDVLRESLGLDGE